MRVTKNIFQISFLLAILLILNIVTVSLSDEKTRLTVGNKTESYLHMSIDGSLYTYVAPNQYVDYQTDPKPELQVQVFYSPGQGKTNAVIDSTFVLPYTPASTTAYGDECSCEDANTEQSCSYTDKVVENPPQGGSARWEITDDDFSNLQ